VLLSKLADLARTLPSKPPASDSPPAVEAAAANDDLAKAGVETASLATLEEVMTAAETREFIEVFCSDAAARLARMTAAKDVAGIAPEAHALISIAGNVGGMRISKLARSVEAACKAGDFQTASAILPSLSAAVAAATSALKAWLAARRV
jgi:HPt (histidine-containing phosphotransfer) domain-containing protein